MSAFCVFGISKSQCLELAAKEVSEWEGGRIGGVPLTPQEWGRRRNIRAAEIFDSHTKVGRISPEFDAPQFCQHWIAVNPEEVRMTKIMVWGGQGRRPRRAGAAQGQAGVRLDRVCSRGGRP